MIFEQAGIPSVAIIADLMRESAQVASRAAGIPDYPFCVVEYPIANLTKAETRARADMIHDRVLELLLRQSGWHPAEVAPSKQESLTDEDENKQRDSIEYESAESARCDFEARGWTDGLPISIPTSRRVSELLSVVGHQFDDVLIRLETRSIEVTAGAVAANAIMADLDPKAFPLVASICGKLDKPGFNLHAHSATMSGAAQVVIPTGGIVGDLEIISDEGLFGPGSKQNLSIGRSVRLVIWNGCMSRRGEFDRATYSQPGRISYCFAESPKPLDAKWSTLGRSLGIAGSGAIVYASTWQLPIISFSRQPLSLLREIAWGARAGCAANKLSSKDVAVSSFETTRPFLFVIGYEHQRVLAQGNVSRSEIQEALFDGLTGGSDRPESDEGDVIAPAAVHSPDNIWIVFSNARGIMQSWFFAPFQSHEGLVVEC